MKQILLIALSIMTIAGNFSCSKTDSKNKPQTLSEVNKLLNTKKSEASRLEKEIKELEKLQHDLDTSGTIKKLVTIDTLLAHRFVHQFSVQGVAASRTNIQIASQATGAIEHIYVKEGDLVRKGQKLLELNTSVIDQNIAEVMTNITLAQTAYEKQSRLWKQGIGSEMQYLQAKNKYESMQNRLASLKAQRALYIINAPVSGTVDDIKPNEGEMALAGQALLRVVNLNQMEIEAEVPESYIGKIHRNDTCAVSFASLPDFKKTGKVVAVGQVINANNRTFKITVLINNQDHQVKPNLLASVHIYDYIKDNALLAPTKLILHDRQDFPYLFSIRHHENSLQAVKKIVQLGLDYNGEVEILGGLREGDVFIRDGYQEISDGADIDIQ